MSCGLRLIVLLYSVCSSNASFAEETTNDPKRQENGRSELNDRADVTAFHGVSSFNGKDAHSEPEFVGPEELDAKRETTISGSEAVSEEGVSDAKVSDDNLKSTSVHQADKDAPIDPEYPVEERQTRTKRGSFSSRIPKLSSESAPVENPSRARRTPRSSRLRAPTKITVGAGKSLSLPRPTSLKNKKRGAGVRTYALTMGRGTRDSKKSKRSSRSPSRSRSPPPSRRARGHGRGRARPAAATKVSAGQGQRSPRARSAGATPPRARSAGRSRSPRRRRRGARTARRTADPLSQTVNLSMMSMMGVGRKDKLEWLRVGLQGDDGQASLAAQKGHDSFLRATPGKDSAFANQKPRFAGVGSIYRKQELQMGDTRELRGHEHWKPRVTTSRLTTPGPIKDRFSGVGSMYHRKDKVSDSVGLAHSALGAKSGSNALRMAPPTRDRFSGKGSIFHSKDHNMPDQIGLAHQDLQSSRRIHFGVAAKDRTDWLKVGLQGDEGQASLQTSQIESAFGKVKQGRDPAFASAQSRFKGVGSIFRKQELLEGDSRELAGHTEWKAKSGPRISDGGAERFTGVGSMYHRQDPVNENVGLAHQNLESTRRIHLEVGREGINKWMKVGLQGDEGQASAETKVLKSGFTVKKVGKTPEFGSVKDRFKGVGSIFHKDSPVAESIGLTHQSLETKRRINFGTGDKGTTEWLKVGLQGDEGAASMQTSKVDTAFGKAKPGRDPAFGNERERFEGVGSIFHKDSPVTESIGLTHQSLETKRRINFGTGDKGTTEWLKVGLQGDEGAASMQTSKVDTTFGKAKPGRDPAFGNERERFEGVGSLYHEQEQHEGDEREMPSHKDWRPKMVSSRMSDPGMTPGRHRRFSSQGSLYHNPEGEDNRELPGHVEWDGRADSAPRVSNSGETTGEPTTTSSGSRGSGSRDSAGSHASSTRRSSTSRIPMARARRYSQ